MIDSLCASEVSAMGIDPVGRIVVYDPKGPAYCTYFGNGGTASNASNQVSGLYVYAAMQNAYRGATIFPRSKQARIDRMDKMVDWKRRKIIERRWRHASVAVAVICGSPLAVAGVIWCWRLAANLIAM